MTTRFFIQRTASRSRKAGRARFQIPYLLTGVVITETLFNYKGFGWLLVQAAGNNDIDLLLGVSVVSVVIVLATQLISDIGYVYLNPRIRIS